MPHPPTYRSFGHLFGIERNAAINTRVTMEFFKNDGKKTPIPTLPKKIPAKWASAPEPLTYDRFEFDSTKLALLHRIVVELLYDSIEGKEGALSDLAIKAINRKHGIIYAASVYSQGGNKTLYMIRYLVTGNSIKFRYRENDVGKYGPLSLISDAKKENVYVLNQEARDEPGLTPVISIIDTISGNTVDKICISADSHHVSPYAGHLLSISNENDTLGVIIDEELYLIDISDKRIIKIFKDKKYSFVAMSSTTSKIYAIAEEEDLESSQPHYNSLHIIESDLQRHQITKFDPIIEASNIRCSNSIICINFRHKEIENEYSFWLFEEDTKRSRKIQIV